MPVPFNHQSLKLAFARHGEQLYRKLVETFGENKKVPIMELREKNDPDLQEVADYVYENVFLHYTMKQWGQTPDQIDPSVTGRVPVFVGDDDRYFPQAPYQGMPKEGYTELFANMLEHDLIDVFCDEHARPAHHRRGPRAGQRRGLRRRGCLHRSFGRAVQPGPGRPAVPHPRHEVRALDVDQFQPVGTVNYTVSKDYTRITEFKNINGQVVPGKTTIMKEYSHAYEPGSGQTPYYAIIDPDNRKLYERYLERVSSVTNFHPVGRLAEYRYYGHGRGDQFRPRAFGRNHFLPCITTKTGTPSKPGPTRS